MKLNKEMLERVNACKEGIDFVERNKLIGFPLERLNEVSGDYGGFVSWLQQRTFDQNNNVIRVEYSDGSWYTKEYDQNNNLIRFEDSDGSWYTKEYDQNNNVIKFEDSDGSLRIYESEFYNNGQLKRYGDLIVPYFGQ